MTKAEFINSGHFVYRNSFLEKNPNTNLHTDCTDVVEYSGGVYIQLLKSGQFYLEDNTLDKSLDVVESLLWNRIEDMNNRMSLEKIEEWKANFNKSKN